MRRLLRAWNYKSAIVSALMRAPIFLTANLSAGTGEALAAGVAEFWFRFATAGFYGAMTETFSRRRTPGSTLRAMLIVPGIAHTFELVVHTWRGTPVIGPAITASIVMTMISTSFNLFAMRRGALLGGEGRRSLLEDMRAMPRLIAGFLVAALVPKPVCRLFKSWARS